MTEPATWAPSAPLRRSLGLIQATALVVGIIIGASIFVQPSEIMRDVPSVGGIFLVWTMAGLLTAAGALMCAELASAWRETGGVYVFLRRTSTRSARSRAHSRSASPSWSPATSR